MDRIELELLLIAASPVEASVPLYLATYRCTLNRDGWTGELASSRTNTAEGRGDDGWDGARILSYQRSMMARTAHGGGED
jgi:hypothetical protein